MKKRTSYDAINMVLDATEVEELGPLQRQQHAEKERLHKNLAFIELFWRHNPVVLEILSVLNASGLGSKRRRVEVLETTLPALDARFKAAEERLDKGMERLKPAKNSDLVTIKDYYLGVYRIAHEVPALVDALTTSVSLLNDLKGLPLPAHCTPDHITPVSFSVDLAYNQLNALKRMLDLMASYITGTSSQSLKTIWHRLYSVVAHLLAETKLCLNAMHTVYAHEHGMVAVDSGSMDSTYEKEKDADIVDKTAINETSHASYVKHLNHLLCQITPTLDAHNAQAGLIVRDTTLLLQHFHRLVAAYAEKHQEDFEIS